MAQCSAMAKLLDLGGLDILAMDDGDDDDEDEFFSTFQIWLPKTASIRMARLQSRLRCKMHCHPWVEPLSR